MSAPLQGVQAEIQTPAADRRQEVEHSSETPALDQYSRDLTELAREGKLDLAVGRAGN